eukprot:6045060-Pleurochrysis_carterae.AAC.2
MSPLRRSILIILPYADNIIILKGSCFLDNPSTSARSGVHEASDALKERRRIPPRAALLPAPCAAVSAGQRRSKDAIAAP